MIISVIDKINKLYVPSREGAMKEVKSCIGQKLWADQLAILHFMRLSFRHILERIEDE